MHPSPEPHPLDRLFAERHIMLERGPIFDVEPRRPRAAGLADRVAGMLLGLAIGDALGNTTEAQNPAARQATHGEIRDYLPNEWADGRPVGVPSDDTQLAFRTLELLIRDGGRLDPERLAHALVEQQVFGMGQTVHDFKNRLHAGVPWWQAGPRSAGNGAVMRIAPLLLPHLAEPSPRLWADIAVGAMVTHNDHAAIAASVGLSHLLWECLADPRPREPAWWLHEFVRVAAPLEGASRYRSRVRRDPFEGTLTAYVARVEQALADGLPSRAACDSWYSGAYVLETMASTLHILGRHANHPEEAIVRAVNDTRDNDTVAAIVGAVVGAMHGRAALPHRWIDDLTGRLGADDDGRVFELVEAALTAFVPNHTTGAP